MKHVVKKAISTVMAGLLTFSGLHMQTVHVHADNGLNEGEMRLRKVAEKVDGTVNTWKVTVTAESKDRTKPVDYILVVDKSASMLYDANNTKNKTEMPNSRIVYARDAAKELVEDIYEADNRNRVAVLSYSSAGTNKIDTNTHEYKPGTTHTELNIELSGKDDVDAVKSAIDGIKAEGGTYTQLALHEAQQLMAKAHAADVNEERERIIILLTDGMPTLAVGVDWDQVPASSYDRADVSAYHGFLQVKDTAGQLVYIDADYGTITTRTHAYSGKKNKPYTTLSVGSTSVPGALVNTEEIPESAFDYKNAAIHTVGYGVNGYVPVDYVPAGETDSVYADLMNLTIAESNYIRKKGDVKGLFVIGYDVSTADSRAIQALAGDAHHYVDAKGETGIKDAMADILKKSSVPDFDAKVTDVIPEGFLDPENVVISCGDVVFEDGVLKWDLGSPNIEVVGTDPVERYATMSYTLRVKDNVYFNPDELFKTNGETKIEYKNPAYPTDPNERISSSVPENEIPEVKVAKYTIKKTVTNDAADPTEFKIQVKSPSGVTNTVTLKHGETSIATKFTETGTYTVTEFVNADGYEVKYLIDGVEKNTFEMSTKDITESQVVHIEVQNTKKPYHAVYAFTGIEENTGNSVPVPAEVLAKLPVDPNEYLHGTAVNKIDPDTFEMTVPTATGTDTWKFLGYDANQKTVDGADVQFNGVWSVVHSDPYNVYYLYESATPGKDLPQDVKNLLPSKVTDLYRDHVVNAEQPAKLEVPVEGGKWTFNGYNKDSITIVDTDDEFIGLWTFEEEKHDVDYEFVSGTPGKDLPASITSMTPQTMTDVVYDTVVDAEQPPVREVSVEGGKWVFEGYDKDNLTIKNTDGHFKGTWNFVPDPEYSVSYNYESDTPGRNLPAEVLALTPTVENRFKTGDDSTPAHPREDRVSVDGGVWVFKGYDRNGLTIADHDETYTGKWVFEPRLSVTYEFASGTTDKDLPDEVKNMLPETERDLPRGTVSTPEQPQKTEVHVSDGVWTFKGYDQDSITLTDTDGHYKGKWTFTPEYKVTYEFMSGTSGKVLPQEVLDQTPDPVLSLKNGTSVNPKQPVAEVKVTGGVWVFDSYDKGSETIDGADVHYKGTWKYLSTYETRHEFASGTPGKDLPQEVLDLLPSDNTDLREDAESHPTPPVMREVPVSGGKWVFKNYDKNTIIFADAERVHVGTWVFVADAPKNPSKPSSPARPVTPSTGRIEGVTYELVKTGDSK